jgi:RNA polymerase sigma-70 factor, ECF subfamily
MEGPILEAFERCQRRFPTVQLSIGFFRSRVEEILSSGMSVDGDARLKAFAAIHHEDLFLATACAQNDRVAWEHFADDYLPLLRSFAAQACRDPNEGEDLAQEITAKLLNDKRRLAGYNGRGSLSGWLRVAVAHAAVDRFRRSSRLVSLDGLQEDGNAGPFVDPGRQEEQDALDSSWGPVMVRMVEECLRSFPPRNRLLLVLYHLHDIPLKDLSRQFGIHEATVSRWLDRMRHDIRKYVERELRKRHRLRSSEIQSLWKWISPSSLADSVRGSPPDTRVPGAGGPVSKKAAIAQKPGVIKKEELR